MPIARIDDLLGAEDYMFAENTGGATFLQLPSLG
jgi:hypothetical protein